MPNHATSSLTAFDVTHSLHHLLNGKKLLVACYLLYPIIVERKAIHQLQQSLWATKIVDICILHRWCQRSIVSLLYICTHITISLAEDLGVDPLLIYLFGQLVAMQLLGCFVCKLLGPLAPKLLGRGGGCITYLIDISRQ